MSKRCRHELETKDGYPDDIICQKVVRDLKSHIRRMHPDAGEQPAEQQQPAQVEG